ncbi:uncharacterized protein BCR38DRAFT_406156 [Pseudomassariella vexata]|uniref:Peptidase S1 domain-containing protein n=1 Tax=Pseudomassariella vexata TaxID=1141098 RepID=A0A1Y2EAC3_9PEZI|nr:uncharacterized protein BCR38DRAFT_406156 [Pseudomassariella vexata]ORY68206.1 hypothetical protein BCR38DRAFT_406156 [Pseudomassariella vexata]
MATLTTTSIIPMLSLATTSLGKSNSTQSLAIILDYPRPSSIMAQSISMRSMTLSEKERNEYYYGLPSQPKLVARSNFRDTLWEPIIKDQHLLPKRIANIGSDHSLVGNYTTELQNRIVGILAGTKWTSIDVLRIGYDDQHQKPVVLWVAVEPRSLDPDLGLQLAEQCRAALSDASIHDVHCEIREATVTTLASHANAQPFLPLNQGALGSTRYHSLTSTLGQSVAAADSDKKEGSLGLYLSVCDPKRKGFPIKCALISHHVAYEKDNDLCKDDVPNSKPKVQILMPGSKKLEDYTHEVTQTVDFWAKNPSLDTTGALKNAQHLREYLATLSATSARCIGHVIYSPARMPKKMSDTATNNDGEWLPDYALVQLNEPRFGDSFVRLANQVFLGTLGQERLQELNHGFLGHHAFVPPADGVLRLKGTIPRGEIASPQEENIITAEHSLRLVRSVTRVNVNRVCSQWCIISGNDRVFSQPGDSGSCIWDLKGRVGGMLDGGSGGQNGSHDITYATHIDQIIGDIQKHFTSVIILGYLDGLCWMTNRGG